jgi:ATP-dependent Clp protease ATP-binding subunit ClpC
MNGYNFTERVRKVLQLSREESLALRHEYVGTEHMLLAICAEGGGVANAALTNLGIADDRLRNDVISAIGPSQAAPSVTAAAPTGGILGAIADSIGFGRPTVDHPYTSRAKKALELAMTEARELGHAYVGTEHLLLGLIREERGIAAQVLVAAGLTTQNLRQEVIRVLGIDRPPGAQATGEQADKNTTDLPATITLVVEHPDGRIEAKKFRRSHEAVSFLNGLEY